MRQRIILYSGWFGAMFAGWFQHADPRTSIPMKTTKKNQLRTAVVALTAAALAYFSFQQYRSHEKNEQVSRQLVQLRVLRSSLAYYDESLTMEARLYVLTKDETWKRRYHQNLQSFDSSVKAIGRLLPERFAGRPQLEASAMALTDMQNRALALVDSEKTDQAKMILLGQEYERRNSLHTKELNRLQQSLDAALSRLVAVRHEHARRNAILNGIMLVLLLSAWIGYLRMAKHWYERISAADRKRAEAAVSAARMVAEVNEQLRGLTIHLQQSREQERLKIASEINEELGQEMAALKMQVNAVRRDIASGAAGDQLKSVSRQLGAVLQNLTSFAHEIYPLVLRDLGIIEALQWASEQMSREAVSVYFLSEETSVSLDQKAAVALFRIYQQRVQAAIEQGASEVLGKFSVDDGELVMTVFDNAPGEAITADVLSGVNIQERIRSLAGRMELQHSAGEGNSFSVSIPYSAPVAAND